MAMPITPTLEPPTIKLAQYISNNSVGCRFGKEPENAAYSLLDFAGNDVRDFDFKNPPTVMETLNWGRDPGNLYHPLWVNRLWNTCGYIVGLSLEGTVLILNNAPPVAERYLYAHEIFKAGKGYTFSKNNRVSGNAATLKKFLTG